MKSILALITANFLLPVVATICTESTSPAQTQLLSWSLSCPTRDTATTPEGIPMPSLTASQAIGTAGHVLLQDGFLLQKTAAFNRERLPERPVHAKGQGAFGHFVVTDDVRHLTKAKLFNGIGKVTEVVTRFSTVAGESGAADTARDSRGFAVKFYTEDGIYDLVGLSIPVFPVRDGMLFEDLNRASKRNPASHLPQPTATLDFAILRPETIHHALHVSSDLGIPKGIRVINGSGVHTFKWVNSFGDPVYIKYTWVSQQPFQYLSDEEATKLAGSNPDYATEDLYDAIVRGEYPTWDLFVQVMTFPEAEIHPQNPFDSTKVWRIEEYPLQRVGRLTLNRNPSDYFTQVEMAAFSPGNMVPGIEPSPDRLLHARIFSYPDAQRYRLGVNFAQLPVNKAKSRVQSYMRDGFGCDGDNGAGAPNYYPNSFGGLEQDPGAAQTAFVVSGDVARHDSGDEDNFSQARLFVEQDLNPEQRARMFETIGNRLSALDPSIQKRWIQNIAYKISQKFGDRASKALAKANNKKFGHNSR